MVIEGADGLTSARKIISRVGMDGCDPYTRICESGVLQNNFVCGSSDTSDSHKLLDKIKSKAGTQCKHSSSV